MGEIIGLFPIFIGTMSGKQPAADDTSDPATRLGTDAINVAAEGRDSRCRYGRYSK